MESVVDGGMLLGLADLEGVIPTMRTSGVLLESVYIL